MKFSSTTWRTLRQITQVLSLLVFIGLFIPTLWTGPQLAWSNLFFRLDPLVALTASLAGRAVLGGMLLSLFTVLLTLLFGRAWCGWLCPLGALLDWLRPFKRARKLKSPVSEKWRLVKYLSLLAVLTAALLANQTLLLFDPITILTRTLAAAVWPALGNSAAGLESFFYHYSFLWNALDWLHQTITLPVFGDVRGYFSAAFPVLLFFAAIVGLNWVAERFWCRYLCPLGGLLGLLSRFALLRREVGEECNACARCARGCPTGTINPDKGFRSDPAECILCMDCLVDCSQQGVAFRWQLPKWKPAESMPYDPSRREVFLTLGAAAAGVALTSVEPIRARQPANLIRPPGALSVDFEALCLRCGECLQVCPTQGLQPSLFEGGWQNLMTPHLTPRLGYCNYNCNACGQICPSGAIPPLTLEEKHTTPMGLARIDTTRCLPWAYNTPCSVCEETCPLPNKAIKQKELQVTTFQGESLTIKQPYVIRELCIGCGACENRCPQGGEAAVRVFVPYTTGSG